MSLSATPAFAADTQTNQASTSYWVADPCVGGELHPNEEAIAQEMAYIIKATKYIQAT